MLTQERLKQLVKYNGDTGLFERITTLSNNSKIGVITGGVFLKGRKNYVKISVDGKRYAAHRLAFLYETGEFPADEVDHIDGDGTNNKWSNLRQVDRRENTKNQRLRSDNTTGIIGVYWYKNRSKWEVKINKNDRIGYFDDFFEACCARRSAENAQGYHTNHGRITKC